VPPPRTFYRSVQVHGVLRPVADRSQKARALGALMAARQPEGGHVPITAEHPLYAKALDGLLVLAVDLADLTGQGQAGAEPLARAARPRAGGPVATRREPGDARGDSIWSGRPTRACPSRLSSRRRRVCGCSARRHRRSPRRRPRCSPGRTGTGRFSLETLAASHVGSSAWVAAVDADGPPRRHRARAERWRQAGVDLRRVRGARAARNRSGQTHRFPSFSTIRSCGTRAGWA
jgi:hypothetical protein